MRYGRVIRPFSSAIGSNSFPSQAKSNHVPISFQSSTSVASVLQHYIGSDSPSRGRTIHAQILKTGFQPNTSVWIKLLILYLKCGLLLHARKVFDQMPRPTLSAYNYMIAGYYKGDLAKELLELVQKLAFSEEKPDGFTLSMVLKLSAALFSLNLARQVHTQIVKSACKQDGVLIAALIDSYVKNEKLGYARTVFDAMSERSTVCSTSLIVGYMNQESPREAEEIFKNMVEKDTVVFNAMIEGYSKRLESAKSSVAVYKNMLRLSFQPTISTFVSVIGACSLMSAFEIGQQVHGQIIKTNIYSHVKSGSALVDMYSKCGRVKDARRIFNHMPEKNIFSWTSMIDGYGKNGIPHEALELFYEMRRNQIVKPNHATFLSALSACAHAGLLSDGREIFHSMEKDYLLKPRMEHYACMVDLLGRLGSLNQAYNFIKQIPEKPNSDVWTALLSASRLHEDVEMAENAAKAVFELSRDERPGAYVALSNTFAATRKWSGVSEVRELMKERGISKGAACSWVGTVDGLCGFHIRNKM